MTRTRKLVVALLVLTLALCFWIGRQQQIAARRQALNMQLLSAVVYNDLPAATRLLDAGADPNAQNEYAVPLSRRLSLALRYPEMRRFLFAPHLSQVAPNALWQARTSHINAMAALLISRGANPNISAAGVPPLIDIELQRDTPMLKTFLDGGVKVNATDGLGMTALMYAARAGRTRDARLLLDAGADVKLKNKAGKTAWELAQENKKADVVKMLTVAGTNK